MIDKLKVGSLYAGIGGICQGFISAGMKVVWANEIDKYAAITYRNNFSHPLFEGDVWSLDPNELENIDILTGGFPCQPFSIAGYRKGFEDQRGNHFNRIVQFAKALKPKAMLLENVKNLTSHDKGNTFKVIMETLNAIGYTPYARVLNSKDFGNIPQNRERIYIVAFKNNESGVDEYGPYFNFPEPIKLNVAVTDYLEENVEEKFYYRENKYNYDELKKAMKSTETVYQWRRQYVRENKQNVCPTLTANMGTGGHNVPLVLVSDGIRKLTPKECFSLQGFSADFKLPENISSAQLYKQAGNSVTVSVISRIAENIKNALEKNSDLNAD